MSRRSVVRSHLQRRVRHGAEDLGACTKKRPSRMAPAKPRPAGRPCPVDADWSSWHGHPVLARETQVRALDPQRGAAPAAPHGGCSSVGRAPDRGSGGRRFEAGQSPDAPHVALTCTDPCSSEDRASAYGAGRRRFDSCHGCDSREAKRSATSTANGEVRVRAPPGISSKSCSSIWQSAYVSDLDQISRESSSLKLRWQSARLKIGRCRFDACRGHGSIV